MHKNKKSSAITTPLRLDYNLCVYVMCNVAIVKMAFSAMKWHSFMDFCIATETSIVLFLNIIRLSWS